MFDKWQFAAAAATWARNNGVCAERVGLTMSQGGRYALTSKFDLFGVSLEENVPKSFFKAAEEAKAYACEAAEHGLLAQTYTYKDGQVVIV